MMQRSEADIPGSNDNLIEENEPPNPPLLNQSKKPHPYTPYTDAGAPTLSGFLLLIAANLVYHLDWILFNSITKKLWSDTGMTKVQKYVNGLDGVVEPWFDPVVVDTK